MYRALLIAMSLLLLGTACTPGLAEPGVYQGDNPAPVSPTEVVASTVVGQAEAIIGARFSGAGYIESVVRIDYADQVIRLTMNRDTSTLGDIEAYSRMCQALTNLIGEDGAQGQVISVQTFRADGSPVVAGTVAGEPCVPPA